MQSDSQSKFNIKTWKKDLLKYDKISQQEKNQIIYDYLICNGFVSVASTFKSEANIPINNEDRKKLETSSLKEEILENMLVGNFKMAKNQIKSKQNDFFEKNRDLKIEFLLIEFLSLVKKSEYEEAVLFGKQKLMKYLDWINSD